MPVLSLCFRDRQRIDSMIEEGRIRLPNSLLPHELENHSTEQLHTMMQQTLLRARAFLLQYMENERKQLATLQKAIDYINNDYYIDCLEEYKNRAQVNSELAASITVKCHVHDMILKAIKWADYQNGKINIDEPAEYKLMKNSALLQQIGEVDKACDTLNRHLAHNKPNISTGTVYTRYTVAYELATQHKNDINTLQRHFAAFAHIMSDGKATAS